MGKKYFALISCFVFLILLFVAPDSYLHDMYSNFDVAVFQLYGKAMMNGMVPYIDFNEGKGPLVFLIYGIGYLLTPYNYIGAFWIIVVAYIIIYYFTFKISHLILENEKKALLATILMTFFYFNPLVQYEVKTESYSQIFILISIYYTMLYNKSDVSISTKQMAFLLGISFAACTLLKVNIAAMIGVFILYEMYYVVKRHEIVNYFVFGLLGVSCVFLPFVIYFIINDAFPKCISEFFYAMTYTIGNYSHETSYIQKLSGFFFEYVTLFTFFAILLGTLWFIKSFREYKWYPLIIFLPVFFVVLQAGAFHYYYIVCNPFYIFGLCAIIKKFSVYNKVIISFTCITFLFVSSANLLRCWKGAATYDLFFQDTPIRQNYYKYAYLMAQIENASFISTGYLQRWDVAAGALPGCKYPLFIPGEPKDVLENRMSAIEKGVDFVYVEPHNNSLRAKLVSLGYNEYNYGGYSLFSKHILKEAPEDFHVSAWDVLMKRDVLKDVRPKE